MDDDHLQLSAVLVGDPPGAVKHELVLELTLLLPYFSVRSKSGAAGIHQVDALLQVVLFPNVVRQCWKDPSWFSTH